MENTMHLPSDGVSASEGKPGASPREDPVEMAARYGAELHEAAMCDRYRVPYVEDGMTHHVARMLRSAQARKGLKKSFRISPMTMASAIGCSFETVNRRLKFLLRHGLLRKLSKGKREIGSAVWQWIGPMDDAQRPESPPDPGSVVFTFGKHRGKSIEEIVEVDREYVEWASCELMSSVGSACHAFLRGVDGKKE